MGQNRELAALWETLAHKVLASVLVDHGAVFPVMEVLGRGMHWFPPKAAKVWAGVVQCVDEGVPPTVEAVRLRTGSTNGYLQAITNQWTDEDNRKVAYHAEELKGLGALAELRKLGRELQEVENPAQVMGSIGFAESRLSGIMAVTSIRKGDAASVNKSAWEMVDRFQGSGIPSGLPWLDDITGGFWPGFDYWVAGNYKAGKSTLMRNFILTALEAGHPADVYLAEGSRELFALDCQAMIATRLLCERGVRQLDQLRLSGLFILRVWRDRLPVLTKDELECINEARDVWNSYNVRVWDVRDGIKDLSALKHRVRQSKYEHSSLIHWADYSQLFGTGKIYERQSTTALTVQELAAGEQVMFGMLTQRNESSIREGSGYSPGVKGGGDASAAADLMLMPMIDAEQRDRMTVKIKLSRRTGTGTGEHIINASSGLIVDRWFKHTQHPDPLPY